MSANLDGLQDFLDDLEKYAKAADDARVAEVLMAGGESLAEDVRKLPRPRRRLSGITHMLDTVKAVKEGAAVQVGWGAYYGAFVERGTRKMRAQRHMGPVWDANKERYYKQMQQKLFEANGGF